MSQLRIADYMSRMLRNLFVVCTPILLAGCQQPLAPSAGAVNNSFVDARTPVRFENTIQHPGPAVPGRIAVLDVSAPVGAKPKDEPLIASVQRQPDSQVGQLADGLMLVFKTFTGH